MDLVSNRKSQVGQPNSSSKWNIDGRSECYFRGSVVTDTGKRAGPFRTIGEDTCGPMTDYKLPDNNMIVGAPAADPGPFQPADRTQD